MIDRLLSHIAPHPCYSCGKLGSILCDYCKYDITDEDFVACVICGAMAGSQGVCQACSSLFSKAWCVGERAGILRKIIDNYKFERVYDAHITLAELLAARLPILPDDCIIAPIPTVPAHIRQRGYDHMLLVAKALARLKDKKTTPLIVRQHNSVQRGQSRQNRLRQAKEAFLVNASVKNKTILLIDDIATTGATLRAAAELLQSHGAKEIWAATLARQPLD